MSEQYFDKMFLELTRKRRMQRSAQKARQEADQAKQEQAWLAQRQTMQAKSGYENKLLVRSW